LAIKGAGGGTRYPTAHGIPPNRKYEASCPNYTADLNACHEFEKFITEDTADLNEYAINLTKIAAPSVCYGEYSCTEAFALLHATARQRCEAYLRTIGKWIE
jgi:hypothetical protein